MPRSGPGWQQGQNARPSIDQFNVVILVDGSDPDSYAAALAATSDVFRLNVVAVIMTGRPVNPDHRAKPYQADLAASKAVLHDNAIRINDLLIRYGRKNIPVFEDGIAPYSTIPHSAHIDERILDVEPLLPNSRLIAGDMDAALNYLAHLPGVIHFISTSPLTPIPKLIKVPEIKKKLGILTAQIGMFGEGGVTMMAGGRRQYNALADPDALRETLAGYPGPVYMASAGVTKRAEFAFANPGELAQLATAPAFKHIYKMYKRAWPIIWVPKNEKFYVQDFHAVELMADLLTSATPPHMISSLEPQELGRYTLSRVSIAHVPSPGPNQDWSEEARWGEIDLKPVPDPDSPLRFLTTGINADPKLHKQLLAQVLNAPPYVPPPSTLSRVQAAFMANRPPRSNPSGYKL